MPALFRQRPPRYAGGLERSPGGWGKNSAMSKPSFAVILSLLDDQMETAAMWLTEGYRQPRELLCSLWARGDEITPADLREGMDLLGECCEFAEMAIEMAIRRKVEPSPRVKRSLEAWRMALELLGTLGAQESDEGPH